MQEKIVAVPGMFEMQNCAAEGLIVTTSQSGRSCDSNIRGMNQRGYQQCLSPCILWNAESLRVPCQLVLLDRNPGLQS